MTHGGGGFENIPKKCHILFEWPLSPKKTGITRGLDIERVDLGRELVE